MIIKPTDLNFPKKVFLAGTIDSGNSTNWQATVTTALLNSNPNTIIMNPRRDEWDSTWPNNDPEHIELNKQINWELEGLEKADIIALWLEPSPKSSASLLELGLHARSGKLIVGCPKEFYRFARVLIVCENYNIPIETDFDGFVAQIIWNL